MAFVQRELGDSTDPPTRISVILTGVLVTMAAANVWLLLLANFGALAAIVEVALLGALIWWAHGGGPPQSMRTARIRAFRRVGLSHREMFWGLVAALSFAVAVHASLVLLFRFIPYPTAAFRQGYDLSIIPTQPMRWLAVVISAASAAICEEIGFRGFVQQPIEARYGVPLAVLTSSGLFTAIHLTKAWALLGMIPIVFGAGVLLGLIAWSAQSLIPCMIGHFLMDVGLFAYWWTGIAGSFSQHPISETGLDRSFLITGCILAASVLTVLIAIFKLLEERLLTAIRSEEASSEAL